MDKFNEFLNSTYEGQAIAFLNAYWDEQQGESEKIWEFTNKFVELDIENKKAGKSLDEFNAHRFLEGVGETKSVVELRDQLKESNIQFNKRLSLIEYLLFRYKKKISEFVKRPQGDNAVEIAKAQQMLAEVQVLMDEAIERAQEAKKALDEQKAALEEVKSEERAKQEKTDMLTKKSEDESIGLVTRNKAKNELAQHLSQDDLPLRKAKITLEAATRKAEKAKKAADAARDDAEKKVAEAEAYLEEVKTRGGGSGQGAIWWIGRELEEKKKYMPKSKGGKW